MGLSCRSAWVTLAASEFNRAIEFYDRLLDQPPTSLIPNVYAEFQLPGLRLGIYKPKQNESSPATPFPAISLCLEVDDLEAAIEQITQINYPPPGEILTSSHGREIYGYDPDGNRLILYQRSSAL
ncbi:MAG: VOC family protein [Phormidesmis sp. CAN_BIN36]|nr:VOC family protein [Phormidesmis sp. CAN_BIN36]